MAHLACESKLCSGVRSYMHPCPGSRMAFGGAVVYSVELPTHLVQELNVGTVHIYSCIQVF